MLTAQEQQDLERRLHDVVCRFCIERHPDGTCGLTAMKECPISTHLPRLIEVAARLESDSMQEYVAKVREDICAVCEYSYSAEDCSTRSEGHCVLDAYLLPIIEVVEVFLSERNVRGTSAD